MRMLMQFLLGLGFGLWLRAMLNRPSPTLNAAEPALEDALRSISGIGPVFENALHSLGIYTFAQLARQDADALGERLGAPATPERIRRERWIEQAKELSGI